MLFIRSIVFSKSEFGLCDDSVCEIADALGGLKQDDIRQRALEEITHCYIL